MIHANELYGNLSSDRSLSLSLSFKDAGHL